MHKTLNLEELIAAKQLEKEKAEESDNLQIEGLYDLIIPPGTVVSIIYDIVEEFDLEPLTRKVFVGIANSEERELLVLPTGEGSGCRKVPLRRNEGLGRKSVTLLIFQAIRLNSVYFFKFLQARGLGKINLELQYG